MASTEGGMEIEEVAANIRRRYLRVGDRSGHRHSSVPRAGKLAFGLGLEGKQVAAAVKFIERACTRRSSSSTASIVEINPLVVTGAGEVIALDAKINFDDNALFRHKDIEELRDEAEEDPTELEAAKH